MTRFPARSSCAGGVKRGTPARDGVGRQGRTGGAGVLPEERAEQDRRDPRLADQRDDEIAAPFEPRRALDWPPPQPNSDTAAPGGSHVASGESHVARRMIREARRQPLASARTSASTIISMSSRKLTF
jgi:hypothetical protein